MNVRKLMPVVAGVCWMIAAVVSVAASPEETSRPIVDKLLKAVEANDYESFIADATADMRAAMTKGMLERASLATAPRLKQGYAMTYLGELNQRGFQVYLWKLTCKDGGDDILARLALKDGKVGGFLLQ